MTAKRLRVALSLLLLPSMAAADNLVQNGDFDADQSHWMVVPGENGGTAVWDGSLGSPNPGSLRMTAGAGLIEQFAQCVPLPSTLAASYSFSANAYVFADSTNTTGNGYALQTKAYIGATCSDAVFYRGNTIVLPVPTTTWTALSNNFNQLPSGYQSMLVAIQVAGNLYYADYAFDHVVLTQVTDRIFGTDFEINEGPR